MDNFQIFCNNWEYINFEHIIFYFIFIEPFFKLDFKIIENLIFEIIVIIP